MGRLVTNWSATKEMHGPLHAKSALYAIIEISDGALGRKFTCGVAKPQCDATGELNMWAFGYHHFSDTTICVRVLGHM